METQVPFTKSPTAIDAMKFKTKFGELYFQTRQMNLRCFPACDIHHFEKTFCGRNVELLVKNSAIQNPSTYICAEFSESEGPRSFNLGDHIPNKRQQVMDEARFMMGKLVMRYEEESKFILSPKGRRWPCSFPRDSTLVIVAYMVQNDHVVQVLTTNSFTIRSKRHKYDDSLTPTAATAVAAKKRGGDDTDSDASSAHEFDESSLPLSSQSVQPPEVSVTSTTSLSRPSTSCTDQSSTYLSPQQYLLPTIQPPQQLQQPSMFFPAMPHLFPTYFQTVQNTHGGLFLPTTAPTMYPQQTQGNAFDADLLREQQVRQAAYMALKLGDTQPPQAPPAKQMRFQ